MKNRKSKRKANQRKRSRIKPVKIKPNKNREKLTVTKESSTSIETPNSGFDQIKYEPVVTLDTAGPYSRQTIVENDDSVFEIFNNLLRCVVVANGEHNNLPEIVEPMGFIGTILPTSEFPYRFSIFSGITGRLGIFCECWDNNISGAHNALLEVLSKLIENNEGILQEFGPTTITSEPYLYLVLPEANKTTDGFDHIVVTSSEKKNYFQTETVINGDTCYFSPLVDVITEKNAPAAYPFYEEYSRQLDKLQLLYKRKHPDSNIFACNSYYFQYQNR